MVVFLTYREGELAIIPADENAIQPVPWTWSKAPVLTQQQRYPICNSAKLSHISLSHLNEALVCFQTGRQNADDKKAPTTTVVHFFYCIFCLQSQKCIKK